MLKRLLRKYLTHKEITYSQYGEDMFLREYFKQKHNGFYINIGEIHPIKFSNTHYLYKKGWCGVNFQCASENIKLFNKQHPRDLNELGLFLPIGYDDEKLVLKSFSGGETTRQCEDIVKVIVRICDFLNINCEGMDFQTQYICDFFLDHWPPKIIIIKLFLKTLRQIYQSETYNFLIKKGYSFRSWYFNSLIFEKN